jgi:hypothetical protein
MRYAFRPAAVSIRPMRVYFNCFVCKAGKLDDDFKKLFNFIHQQHARRKRIRLLECRHQVLGPLPVEWTPTLSPEHVTCKPFSDTPNPYGMRRRNKGNYEPYNTNNGENHCILAKYVTRWVRWTRAGLGELDRARNVLHDPDRKHQPLSFQWVTRVGSRGDEKKCKEISASALCASSLRRHRGGSATWEIGHRLAAGVSVCPTRRTLRRSLRAARDERSAPDCDAGFLPC